jgi:hypothetical protein
MNYGLEKEILNFDACKEESQEVEKEQLKENNEFLNRIIELLKEELKQKSAFLK